MLSMPRSVKAGDRSTECITLSNYTSTMAVGHVGLCQLATMCQPVALSCFPICEKGLSATERENEITLYVFPDAQELDNATDFYGLYTDGN